MIIRIKNGLSLRIGANPSDEINGGKTSRTSTLMGWDYPGIRLRPLVGEGHRVCAGEPVLCDRRRANVKLTAPLSGTVSAIHYGARRRLQSLQITTDDRIENTRFDIPVRLNSDNIQKLMLESGLWATLRCRPYGYIPDPGRTPRALLITAIDTQPLASNPAVAISMFSDEFSTGLKTLCDLVASPVYICKSAGQSLDYDEALRLTVAEFEGCHPAGLAGTHIHHLCPIGFDAEEVWHIGYQDVISLGHLIRHGIPWYQRVVSLAGSAVLNPRLMMLPLGVAIDDVIADELVDGTAQVYSGSVFDGHVAAGHHAYLGQRHNQITALSIDPALPAEIQPTALIPTPDLDRVAPADILATPFLRALLVGDIDRARDLGALELVEEDLALLSYLCPSKTDYRPLLRNMLDQMYQEGVSNLA